MKLRFLALAMAYALALPIHAQPAKGTYNGLFLCTTQLTAQNSGLFTLTTSGSGAFSGKLQIGNTRASLSGTFIGGLANLVVHPSRLQSLNVQLQWDDLSGRITGSVSDGSSMADLVGDRAGFNGKSLIAPQSGHYTVLILGTNNSPSTPAADGYGTVTVSTAGRISLIGTLPDGTRITESASLATNGNWPLYVPLYSGKGSFMSRVTFTNSRQSELNGDLNWIKPANPMAKYYAAGFTNETAILGFVYQQPPKGNTVLDFSKGAVVLEGGNLAQNITNHVLLDLNDRVSNLEQNKLKMTVTLPIGAFRGTVTDPVTLKTIPFGGVVVQSQNRGAGSFLGTSDAGQVQFGPAQGDVVQFQSLGNSFSAQVSCDTAVTEAFRWLWSDDTTSVDTNATKSFGSHGNRLQLLTAFPSGVVNSINIGFDASDGGETTPLNTNLQPQHVGSVSFPFPLTGLRYWASSYNPITNTLDFTGFTSLEAIECFHCTNLEGVVVSNLPSLKRVCLEACNLPDLDISGDPNLEDVRAALNSFTNINIGAGTGPKIWHFCTRENLNITQRFQDIMTNFYSLREPWIWHNNQSGHLSFVSTNLTDVEFWGNNYTSADLSGQTNLFFLQAQENALTNLVLTGCTGLQYFEAERNNLPSEVLNQIVIALQSCPIQFANLTQQNGGVGFLTSPEALNAYTNLINQGVHIYVDWP